MFMTLLANGLWMFFLLIFGVLLVGGAAAYREELESIDIPDAE